MKKLLLVNADTHVRDKINRAMDAEYEIVDVAADEARSAIDASRDTSVVFMDDDTRAMIGNSVVARHLREKVAIVAGTGAPTLVTGESGAGKETAARAIHAASDSTGPFVKVSCSAIPAALLEQELFGDDVAVGKLKDAAGGTVLLCDVDEMDYGVQSRLIQAVKQTMLKNVRLIATTTRDMVALVRDGHFREDLYYHLSVVSLEVPPLRNRREDIPLFVDHFIDLHARRNNRDRTRLTDEAMDKLTRAQWDGNVRQLESVVERAAIIKSGQTLDAGDFQFDNTRDEQMSKIEEAFRYGSIREMEKLMILNRLLENDDNRTRSARTLDISVRTLRNKLHEYDVPRKGSAGRPAPELESVLA